MFNMFFGTPVLFAMVFGLITLGVVGGILYVIAKSITGWAKNNSQAIYSDPAKVIDKRTHVWGGSNNTGSSTSYYITFEYENGERQEFMVSASVFSQFAAGDLGTLTWQGTRFHDFQRVKL